MAYFTPTRSPFEAFSDNYDRSSRREFEFAKAFTDGARADEKLRQANDASVILQDQYYELTKPEKISGMAYLDQDRPLTLQAKQIANALGAENLGFIQQTNQARISSTNAQNAFTGGKLGIANSLMPIAKTTAEIEANQRLNTATANNSVLTPSVLGKLAEMRLAAAKRNLEPQSIPSAGIAGYIQEQNPNAMGPFQNPNETPSDIPIPKSSLPNYDTRTYPPASSPTPAVNNKQRLSELIAKQNEARMMYLSTKDRNYLNVADGYTSLISSLLPNPTSDMSYEVQEDLTPLQKMQLELAGYKNK